MKDIQLVSWVKRGKNRKLVLQALDKQMLPSELVVKIYGKSTNTSFNLVSRALREMENMGLVKLINPKERTGRLYRLTKKGKEIKKKI